MKVRMLISMAGPDVLIIPGDVLDVAGEVGREWIAVGYAEEIEPEYETATAPPAPEKAVGKAGRKKAT
jgi:hypothetical protein